jgi:hypothetical protein
MVLARKIRIFNKIFITAVLVLSLSCEDQGLIVKCPDCLGDEPTKTDLNVKLDASSSSYLTLITVYEGNIEDSVIYNSFNTTSSEASISVTLNKKYTVTATYHSHNNFYVAVDAAVPRVRYEKTQCDNPCYFVYDKTIDLRLKYTR